MEKIKTLNENNLSRLLDKVILKYLDMELDGLEERKGMHLDIVLGYPGYEYGIIGIQKRGDEGVYVYVCYGLIDKIITLFSMEKSGALDVIGRYVGNRYNLRVIQTVRLQALIDGLLGIDTI